MTKNSRFCELLYVISLRQPYDVSKEKSSCYSDCDDTMLLIVPFFKLFPVDYEINRFESV